MPRIDGRKGKDNIEPQKTTGSEHPRKGRVKEGTEPKPTPKAKSKEIEAPTTREIKERKPQLTQKKPSLLKSLKDKKTDITKLSKDDFLKGLKGK